MPDELGRKTLPVKPLARAEGDLDTMHKRETLELVRAYYQIENADVRQRLRDIVRAVAGEHRRGRRPNVRS